METLLDGGPHRHAARPAQLRHGVAARPPGIAGAGGDRHAAGGYRLARGRDHCARQGQRHDRVPLPPDVGEALADYIRSDRVTDVARTLRHRAATAPAVQGRSDAQCDSQGRLRQNRLEAAGAVCGIACSAAQPGDASGPARASLEEIGDMLRHRSRASTMIYARLDVDGLRSIAQPWPVAGGAQ